MVPATVFGRDSASDGATRTVKFCGVRKFYMVIELLCQALTEFMTRNDREDTNSKFLPRGSEKTRRVQTVLQNCLDGISFDNILGETFG